MTGLAIPVLASEVPGNYLTAALWTANVYNLGTFLLNPPDFVGTQTVAQSLPNTTWTALTLDTQQLDSYGGHSLVSNTSRYVAPLTGWYTVSGVAGIANNPSGARGARINVNGSPVQGCATFLFAASGVDLGIPTPTRDIHLNTGDYVEVCGYQNSGGALNSAIFPDIASSLFVRFSHV
ncbi:hypothetical protein [Kitasatospora cathayae]|uniref:C1q domain-containing protein n=1 Tax=Kitasatospora cathayae TaxID=3004092 RepID=A0ABY7QBE7_9ACTN|nr:hypothetical protein [Kitasatospora sp. HUAS 3-15]WBP89544.1 hypothetical protein O1G21_29345 [Kitasatospora sp. HUAS 3-15]